MNTQKLGDIHLGPAVESGNEGKHGRDVAGCLLFDAAFCLVSQSSLTSEPGINFATTTEGALAELRKQFSGTESNPIVEAYDYLLQSRAIHRRNIRFAPAVPIRPTFEELFADALALAFCHESKGLS